MYVKFEFQSSQIVSVKKHVKIKDINLTSDTVIAVVWRH